MENVAVIKKANTELTSSLGLTFDDRIFSCGGIVVDIDRCHWLALLVFLYGLIITWKNVFFRDDIT